MSPELYVALKQWRDQLRQDGNLEWMLIDRELSRGRDELRLAEREKPQAVQFERTPDEGLLNKQHTTDGTDTDMLSQLQDAGFGSGGIM